MTSSRKAGSDSGGALRLYERDTDLNPRTFLTWTGLVIQVTLVQWCQFGTWCDRCTVQSNDLCGPFEPSARPYRRRCQPVYHTLSYLLCFPGHGHFSHHSSQPEASYLNTCPYLPSHSIISRPYLWSHCASEHFWAQTSLTWHGEAV